jgi:hypothetical protein
MDAKSPFAELARRGFELIGNRLARLGGRLPVKVEISRWGRVYPGSIRTRTLVLTGIRDPTVPLEKGIAGIIVGGGFG